MGRWMSCGPTDPTWRRTRSRGRSTSNTSSPTASSSCARRRWCRPRTSASNASHNAESYVLLEDLDDLPLVGDDGVLDLLRQISLRGGYDVALTWREGELDALPVQSLQQITRTYATFAALIVGHSQLLPRWPPLSVAHYDIPRPVRRYPRIFDELLNEALAVGPDVVVAALEILVVLAGVAAAEVPREPHSSPELRIGDVEAFGRALEDVLQMVGVAPIALENRCGF